VTAAIAAWEDVGRSQMSRALSCYVRFREGRLDEQVLSLISLALLL
jgi:hypothetical protein